MPFSACPLPSQNDICEDVEEGASVVSLLIDSRTGRHIFNDGSHWNDLRKGFGFELPYEILKMIHDYLIEHEFEWLFGLLNTFSFAEHYGKPSAHVDFLVSTMGVKRPNVYLNRLRNAEEKGSYIVCNCGMPHAFAAPTEGVGEDDSDDHDTVGVGGESFLYHYLGHLSDAVGNLQFGLKDFSEE